VTAQRQPIAAWEALYGGLTELTASPTPYWIETRGNIVILSKTIEIGPIHLL
jgi:hypothetical protein